ncbi:hypothetical protein FQA39_LY18231 [Lamprigera yunnana]|nr:hypothetical protein FQA39_LY18231 [Lamprigera yunnana]
MFAMVFRKLLEIPRPYLCLAVLRVILTCLPQTGYIHPDEYFQSIEAIAGKCLNIKVNKPWEFNVTQPIRTIAPIYFTIGTSYHILKLLHMFLEPLNISLMSSYFIIVFPRLVICCLSFLVDWSLHRVCLANSERSKSRCLILASSYIMIVYATRTFSNTIELILFSLLLYYVSETLIFSNINIRQREYINKRYYNAETPVEKAKFHKLRLYLENDSLRSYFIISTITTAGFFNRPTFAAYAIAPVFFWLYRGIGFKSIATLQFHFRTIVFLISIIPTIFLFVTVDSFFFGYLTWGEIGSSEISINNFVVTPWNFIKYNSKASNLAQHGLHPHYLHAFVNLPLLFSILAFMWYSNLADHLRSISRNKFHYLPSMRSIRGLMTMSILFPLGILSIFPHQEPRFLIPLLLPMVYLYAPSILPEDIGIVVKSKRAKVGAMKKVQKSSNIFKMWLIINLLLALFYGFIHQGGVYRFTSHLDTQMTNTNDNLYYEVVTSHIYSIPYSLFHQEERTERSPFRRIKRVKFYEKGSTNIVDVLNTIKNLLKIRSQSVSNFSYKLYLVIPESLVDYLMLHLSEGEYSNVIAIETLTFYPHLSTEALPIPSYTDLLSEPSWTVFNFVKSFGLTRVDFRLKA